jgi:tRNA (guanine37-N1)-methyltransferase
MRIDVVSIFPEYLQPLQLSLIGKARASGLLDVAVHDLRDFAHDRHRTVDDTPAGGGAGMVMKPEPWGEALDHVVGTGRKALAPDAGREVAGPDVPTLVVPGPSGARFTQSTARQLAALPWLVFACGRYEGIDERVVDDAASRMPVLSISLGDYVLNGGEVAVLVIVEAVARLLPGVIGNAESLVEESHEDGLLEYPVYTKPAQWRGSDVPAVLMSGHHAQVRRWRRDQRLIRTARRRPDLVSALDPAALDPADLAVLAAEGWTPSARGWTFSPPVT